MAATKILVLLGGVLLSSLMAAVEAIDPYTAPGSSQRINATVVQGYVFCQNCYKDWSRHLGGAEVSVECTAISTGKLVALGKGVSRENGYVEIRLDGYDYSSKLKIHRCLAKIVRSRDPSCDYRTNVNSGYSGAKPQFSGVAGNIAYFTTNAFSFTPMCSY
ncbi:uncharacterized protein LOC9662111 [Selaginella moellendorffii]|uniref:uncharacterized protein LOC9662111 n=1 Tax=Selaginella moellendorffii TaxID=88036 RepID=UPI000D1CDAA3|nr:uncharacterized protein LOC9662111 [Selaginella moellendorffii]|eukprot:XP_024543663.1 uncharacterized protein LOC9662111 [Selaginella moellendorffii]